MAMSMNYAELAEQNSARLLAQINNKEINGEPIRFCQTGCRSFDRVAIPDHGVGVYVASQELHAPGCPRTEDSRVVIANGNRLDIPSCR
jgi:hypothetical protein